MSHEYPKSTAVVSKFLIQMFDAAGLDTNAIFENSEIDQNILEDSSGRIPHAKILNMWTLAAEMSGDPLFGLHLANVVPTVPFNTVGYLAMSAPDLRQTLMSIGQYVRVFSDIGKFELTVNTDTATVSFDLSGGYEPNQTHSEFWMTFLIRSLRDLIGWELPILEIGFRHNGQIDLDDYRQVIEAEYQFGQRENYFTFNEQHLSRPNINADPSVHLVLEGQATKQLGALKEAPIIDRIRRAIFDAFPAKVIELEDVAAVLNMTPRTIQRHLAKEGTSFRDLLDSLRREYAESSLRETELSVSEIAFRLGYLDLSSFYRAFKRWNGVTPIEFREKF